MYNTIQYNGFGLDFFALRAFAMIMNHGVPHARFGAGCSRCSQLYCGDRRKHEIKYQRVASLESTEVARFPAYCEA
jgi:hypothetical protein